ILPIMNVQPMVVTQPQTVVVVQPQANHWQTDLCDCCSECDIWIHLWGYLHCGVFPHLFSLPNPERYQKKKTNGDILEDFTLSSFGPLYLSFFKLEF
ncbi:hypothetical protein Chor_001194, partial [Crotalus horridus]